MIETATAHRAGVRSPLTDLPGLAVSIVPEQPNTGVIFELQCKDGTIVSTIIRRDDARLLHNWLGNELASR